MKKIICLIIFIINIFVFTGCGKHDIDKHVHDFSVFKVVEPTCTREGRTIYSCKDCGFRVSDAISAIDSGGHNYHNLVCMECGDFLIDEAIDTETLSYSKSFDDEGNEIYVVRGITTESEYIKIPAIHNGIPVRQIADEAFWNLLSLKHIIIPDSVVSIGKSAFKYCLNLISVVMPDSVAEIDEDVFWDCQKLKSISIPKRTTIIKDYTYIGCESVIDIEIPDGVTQVGVHAFSDCYNLTSITIPVSVKQILHGAFWDCRNLKDIYYMGTKQQWIAIYKEVGKYNTNEDASWNAYTGNYVIHCSDGQIKK